MAKKKQISLFDQAKSFRDSDTAKAVGTVIAVLLIPASVIAWNYLSSATSENDINGSGVSTEMVKEQSSENSQLTNEESTDKMPIESSENGIGGIGEVKTLPDTNSRE